MKKLLSVLLALMMISSSLVYALPVSVATVETAAEEESVESDAYDVENGAKENDELQDEAVLLTEDGWTHSQHGELLFDIDFEKGNKYTYGTPLTSYGSVNPNYSGSDAWNLRSSGVANASVVTVGKNSYIEFSNGKSKYPQMAIYTANTDLFVTENGVFTILADVLADVTGDIGSYDNNGTATPITANSFSVNARYQYTLSGSETIKRDGNNGSQLSRSVSASSYVPGEWKSFSGVWKFTEDTSKGSIFDSIYQLIFNFNYAKDPVNEGAHIYGLDNIKMYYKPFTADLTIDMNGNTVATPIAGLTDYDTTQIVDISAIESTVIDHGDKIFLGFSFTPDGEVITEDFYLTKDTTIYAVWKDYVKSKYSHDMSSTTNVNWSAKGLNNTVTAAVAETEEGTGTQYVRFGFESKDGYALIDDANFDINKNFSSNMPIADIKALQMRMRISEAPDFLEKYPEEYTNEELGITYPAATSSTKYSHKKIGDSTRTHSFNSTYVAQNIYFLTDDGERTSLGEARNEFVNYLDLQPGGKHGDKWVTIYVDLDTVCQDSGTNTYFWLSSEHLKYMRIDFAPVLVDGMTVDFDYIHFIERDADEMIQPACDIYFLNGNEKTPVTGSMTGIDYRKNSVLCFDFDRDIGLTAEEFRARLTANGATSGLFDAYCEYDSENFVYTLYEESVLVGQTFKLGSFSSAFRADTVPVRFEEKYDNLTLEYATYTAFDDGENLVPNGEFDVPYYDPFADNSMFEKAIKNGSLYVTHTENATEWASNAMSFVSLKENTNYYIALDIDHVSSDVQDYTVTDDTRSLSITLYFPRADSFFNFGDDSKSIDDDEIKYIPSLTNAGNWAINKANLDTEQSAHVRIMQIHDDAYYNVMARRVSATDWRWGSYTAASLAELQELVPDTTLATDRYFGHGLWSSTYKSTFFKNPAITIQTCFTNGKEYGLTLENKKITGASGIAYKIDSFVIKEMFDVNLVYEDGTAIETRWAAKDVEIYLPELYDELGNPYMWKDAEGNVYDPAEAFVLTQAGDITLTASSTFENAPTNEEKTSVRTSGYTGIRFLASVSSTLKNETSEYGFIVTRKTLLDAAGLTAQELTFANGNKVAFVAEASYSAETGKDFVFSMEGDTVFFTGLMVGIPEENLDDVIVVRPYSKIDGKYFYGTPTSDSILDVAKRICAKGYVDANGNPLDERTTNYLKNVLEVYGENSDPDAILMLTAEELYVGTRILPDSSCTVEIVTDPTNPANKVYKVTPKMGSYTHFICNDKMQIVADATYEISADVMVITDEGAYDTTTGEKLDDCVIKVEEDTGYVYGEQGDLDVYCKGRGILYTTTHEPMTGKLLNCLSFTKITTSAAAINAINNGGFGFITDSVLTTSGEENVSVRLPFYIDNLVIKKIADPVAE